MVLYLFSFACLFCSFASFLGRKMAFGRTPSWVWLAVMHCAALPCWDLVLGRNRLRTW
jgi:hypothetical protein